MDRVSFGDAEYAAKKKTARREVFPADRDKVVPSCRIPDDCIDARRYPLFMARDVMRRAIELIKAKIQRGAAS